MIVLPIGAGLLAVDTIDCYLTTGTDDRFFN